MNGKAVAMSTFPVTADEHSWHSHSLFLRKPQVCGWLGEEKASLACRGKELVSSEPLHELEAASVTSSLNATSPWKLRL